MYHNIGRAPAGTILRSLYVKPSSFARQMGMMKKLGYRGLNLSQAIPYLRGEKQGRVFVITFDDGYQDILDNALPVLRKNYFNATCYVVSNALGKYNDWDEDILKTRKPLMDENALRQWLSAGMEIGSHTCTHIRLTGCNSDDLLKEIMGSKDDLENRFGLQIDHFCYPYGAYSAKVIETVSTAGYVTATTTKRGRYSLGKELLELHRVLIGGHNWLPQILIKFFTNYEDRRS